MADTWVSISVQLQHKETGSRTFSDIGVNCNSLPGDVIAKVQSRANAGKSRAKVYIESYVLCLESDNVPLPRGSRLQAVLQNGQKFICRLSSGTTQPSAHVTPTPAAPVPGPAAAVLPPPPPYPGPPAVTVQYAPAVAPPPPVAQPAAPNYAAPPAPTSILPTAWTNQPVMVHDLLNPSSNTLDPTLVALVVALLVLVLLMED